MKIKVLSEFGDVGRCIFVPSDGAPPASSIYVKLNVSWIYQYRTDMKHAADLKPVSKSLDIKCSSFRS